jgi:branched-chain amino acid transport system permease protein
MRSSGLVYLAFLAAGLALPFVAGAYAVSVGLTLAMWVALTQSWALLSGLAGYVSLGHVVFYGIGAYVVALSWGVLPLYVSLPLAGLLAGLFAALVGLPVLRVRGPYFVILTFGLAQLCKFVVVAVESALGTFSRLLFGAPSDVTLYWLMLGLAVAATLLALLLRQSRIGEGLRALRENEEAAATLGVPVVRYKLLAYALSAVIPGVVGAVMTLRTTYFEPDGAFDPTISFTIVTMAVIGGSDDALGPLLGSTLLLALSELLWAQAPQLYMIVLGLLLILFVLLAPDGIGGWLRPRRLRS